MSEIVLFIDDLRSSSSISMCRICHEAEFESCKTLETPCACSGTVKVYMFSRIFFLFIDHIFSLGFHLIIEYSDLFLVLVSSLPTEIAYRDGAMKRGTQLVKFAYRCIYIKIYIYILLWY